MTTGIRQTQAAHALCFLFLVSCSDSSARRGFEVADIVELVTTEGRVLLSPRARLSLVSSAVCLKRQSLRRVAHVLFSQKKFWKRLQLHFTSMMSVDSGNVL